MNRKLILFCIILCLILVGCTNTKAKEATPVPTEKPVPTSTKTKTPVPTATKTSTKVPPTPTITQTSTPVPPTMTPTPEMNYRLFGINVGPYLTEDPNLGATVSEEDLRNLITKIAPYTYNIRTFGCGNGLDKAGKIAHELGLGVYAGAWLGKDLEANKKEMACIIDMAKRGDLDVAIIGNETILRGDLTEQQLVDYIVWFKQEVPHGVSVTTVETWRNIIELPSVVNAVDVVSVNMYPYHENAKPDKAAPITVKWYEEIKYFTFSVSLNWVGKDVIITETGWPSCGKNGSPKDQLTYLSDMVKLDQQFDRPFFWFEAFDEPWKEKYEGEAGACWGLWDNQENLKDGVQDIFDSSDFRSVNPSIEISFVPRIGSDGGFYCINCLRGYALGVRPQDYRVVVYIYVPSGGGWWIKPYYDMPLTEIAENGEWICEIVTGGYDSDATKIAVFLVPKDYSPPLATGWDSIPQEIYDIALDHKEVTRK
jgi:exo-beta-1,3-glucanase (GH17 family)